MERIVIAVDAMGGDHAPEEVVKGALAAVKEAEIKVLLVGKEEIISPFLKETSSLPVEVVNA